MNLFRTFALVFLCGISACSAQENSAQDPAVSEQQIAENDVWHKAKLRGVAFRAIGQEPAWLLEIKNGEEILIVTDYGQNRVAHPWVQPIEDKAARRTVFEIDADTRVIIEGLACIDSMSGEKFETRVSIATGTQTLEGCGRALF